MKKKIIPIIIAIIVIIIATIGILYFTTDLFKSPEQLFYRHIEQNAKMLGNSDYISSVENMKKLQESSYMLTGDINMKVDTGRESDQQLADALAKAKINYTVKNIGNEQKTQTDMTLNYDNKDVLTFNVIKNKEQYGIKIADIYDKYISIENNNLKALAEKLGMDATQIPDKIEALDIYSLLTIDKNTFNHINNTYTNIVKENIPADCYTVEKNTAINFDGADIQANAYKLTLTQEQLKNLTIKILETLKTDDTTLDLIVEKYNKATQLNNTNTNAQQLTKEELVKEIEEMLADLNAATMNTSNALEIATYTTKEDKTRIEITAEDTIMTMDMSKDEKAKLMDVTLKDVDTNMNIVTKLEENIVNMAMRIDANGEITEITVNQKMEENKDIVIDDFTNDNSVKVNDMSTQEINALLQTLYTNTMKVLPDKLQLLGINV